MRVLRLCATTTTTGAATAAFAGGLGGRCMGGRGVFVAVYNVPLTAPFFLRRELPTNALLLTLRERAKRLAGSSP